jgi:sn-glycerol 3-phosphate transport system permease protein
MALVDESYGLRKVGRYVLLVVVAVIVLAPVYVTVIGAFKPGNKLLDFPRSLLPVDLTLGTLRDAWHLGHLSTYIANSMKVSFAITAGQLVTSVLSAYAFAFCQFPLQRTLFYVFLATLMVPAEATVLANTRLMQSLRWTNSYRGLIVPFLATAFGTFLLRQVFLGIPPELREAAALDGVGHVRFLTSVAGPIARPTLGALGLFSFLAAWNQYLWPLRITNEDRYRTVQIGLRQLRSSNVDRLNLVMAGTAIAAIPILVVLLVFQRQLVRGLTAGAVKG